MELLPYDPKVQVLHATPFPAAMVFTAMSNTMKGPFVKGTAAPEPIAKAIQYVYEANHGSVLEHAFITFELSQISRSCGDQLMRHRMASPTSSSMHYQDHSEYKGRIDPDEFFDTDLSPTGKWPSPDFFGPANAAMEAYQDLINSGTDKAEARQVLPMCTEVRIIWTINARSLANFLNLRLCARNTKEIYKLAKELYTHANAWFPELFHIVGPDCFMGDCKQGKLKCTSKS